MLTKLTELLETLSSRRTFIGRCSARIVALTAGIFGFTQLAKAVTCRCGRKVTCCCLCKVHDPGCRASCKAQSGTCSWAWTCFESHPGGYWAKVCYECFVDSSPCSDDCNENICDNVMCSQHIDYPPGFPIDYGTCECEAQ